MRDLKNTYQTAWESSFDKTYYESETYKLGRELVLKGLRGRDALSERGWIGLGQSGR